MAAWYLGTMGFAYETWRGVFYPLELPDRNFLPFYSQVFNAVEVDSTFYGTPREGAVQRWSAVTPEGFRICAKIPRVITHELSLVGAQVETAAFLETMRQLESKLGPILIQFPPSFTAERFDPLKAFLAALPPDLRFAVEFRHGSWYAASGNITETKVAEMLSEYGICWAGTHYPGLPSRIHPTADFFYIRWIGQHGSFKTHERERIDRTADLEGWWKLIQPYLGRVTDIYGFFNNDYAGHAPASCNRFKRIAGLPVTEPPTPKQGTLFE